MTIEDLKTRKDLLRLKIKEKRKRSRHKGQPSTVTSIVPTIVPSSQPRKEKEDDTEVFDFSSKCHSLSHLISGDYDKIIISNFIIDLKYLFEECPELKTKGQENVTIIGQNIYSDIDADDDSLISSKSSQHAFIFESKPRIEYGCHHSKYMLLDFGDRIRVIIMTANIRAKDFDMFQQGFFVKDFERFQKDGEYVLPLESFESIGILQEKLKFLSPEHQHFGTDLIDYLSHNDIDHLRQNRSRSKEFREFVQRRWHWIRVLNQTNFSCVSRHTRLVASIPESKENHGRFGHWKVRRLLREMYKPVNADYIIAQSSSMGGSGNEFMNAIERSFQASKASATSTTTSLPPMRVLWPSKSDVSIETGDCICLNLDHLIETEDNEDKCPSRNDYFPQEFHDLSCVKHWKLQSRWDRMFKLIDCGHGAGTKGGECFHVGAASQSEADNDFGRITKPPHLKTYALVCHPLNINYSNNNNNNNNNNNSSSSSNSSNPPLGWMMVGSHNLSAAAWGYESINKNGVHKLSMRSFELSVLSIASSSDGDGGGDGGEGSHGHLPLCNSLPYDIRREIQEQFTKVGDDNVTSDDVPWTSSFLPSRSAAALKSNEK